jgi:sugar lactone lactonase YvrE
MTNRLSALGGLSATTTLLVALGLALPACDGDTSSPGGTTPGGDATPIDSGGADVGAVTDASGDVDSGGLEDGAGSVDVAADDDAASDAQDSAAPLEDVGATGDAGDAEDDAGAEPLPLHEAYELEAEAYPESVAFDPVSRAFFTGSLKLGNVLRTDGVTGAQSEWFAGNGPNEWLVLGLEVDATRRRLWVCTVEGKKMLRGEVWAFDLESGERTLTVDLEDAAPGGLCTDFAVHSDGSVYVTDREAGRIYHIDPSVPDGLSIYVEDPQLAPELIGQNGIVLTPNESALLSEKYLPQKLVRVDLTIPASPVVTTLDLDFGDLTGGADDMVVYDGRAYLVMEDRLAEVTFDDESWSSGEVTSVFPILPSKEGGLVGGFSGLTVAEGAIYASRSDVLLFAFDTPSTLPFLLQRVDLTAP